MKIPGPQTGYTDLIDEALLKVEAEKDSNYFPLRPSAAGYCSRRLAYDLMQYRGHATYEKEVKRPDTLRLLNLGSSIEWHSIKNFDLIQKVDPTFKVKYKQQSVVLFRLEDTQELVEGSIDLALVGTNDGAILDVKSKGDKFSKAFKTAWDESIEAFRNFKSLVTISETAFYAPNLETFLEELKDPFFADNFHQVNAYLCTEWSKQHGFTHGAIYRYNKNDSQHLEIRFAPSDNLFRAFQDKCNKVNAAVEKQDPESVPKDYMLGSSRCAFCPYAKECWGDADSLKEYFKTFPQKQWPVDSKLLDDGLDDEIEALYGQYQVGVLEAAAKEEVEEKILKIMTDSGVEKIRFKNGDVYEAKYLKSPKPHFELRRSKA